MTTSTPSAKKPHQGSGPPVQRRADTAPAGGTPVAPPGEEHDEAKGDAPDSWRRRIRGRLDAVDALYEFILASLVGAVVFILLAIRLEGSGVLTPEWLLRLFAYTLLASFPTWLYVRFLGVKLNALYTEYVLNLHRLGVDHPGNLPEPSRSSEYFEPWHAASSGKSHDELDNVYEQKFEAYFGKRPGPGAVDDSRVGSGSLLPVFVVWAAFSAGWLTVLLDPGFPAADAAASNGLGDMLRFAFLGAYVFSLQVLVRAYFQNDMRSSTYVGALERLAVVLILMSIIHVVWDLAPGGTSSYALEVGFAFIVGSFPLLGQQWLNTVIAGRLRLTINLASRHPLDSIDGMNVWYQARLLEEGIEDVQNLATANLVEVVLHSRAPVGRLVDWMDQALLLQHLPPRPPKKEDAEGKHRLAEALYEALEALGVRGATDLLELYAPLTTGTRTELHHRVQPIWPTGADEKAFHENLLDFMDQDGRLGLRQRLLALLRCLGSEPNLQLVLNWQTGMADYKKSTKGGTAHSTHI